MAILGIYPQVAGPVVRTIGGGGGEGGGDGFKSDTEHGVRTPCESHEAKATPKRRGVNQPLALSISPAKRSKR